MSLCENWAPRLYCLCCAWGGEGGVCELFYLLDYIYSFITSHHGITVFLCEMVVGGMGGGKDIGQVVN